MRAIMVGLILAVSALANQDAPAINDYYKFKEGTTWTYESVTEANGQIVKYDTELKVTGGKDDKIYLEMSDGSSTSGIVWYVSDGYLVWGQRDGDDLRPMLKVYKLDSKKGDKWDGMAAGLPFVVNMENMGTEEVEVPAGKYKDVIHTHMMVKLDDGSEVHLHYYLAPKVGLIKISGEQPGVKYAMSMKKFTNGK